MSKLIDINVYENRHNKKFPNSLIKLVKRDGSYFYFETEFGLCKKHYTTFGKCNYGISSAVNKTEFLKAKLSKLYKNSESIFLFDTYINNKQLIQMKCDIHGYKNKTIGYVLTGKATCQSCSNILNNPNKCYTNIAFIEKAVKIHGDKYDYSLVNYINRKQKVKIICPIHGVFEQTPSNHLKPSNCPICNNNLKHLNGCGWSFKKWEYNGNKSKYYDSFKVYIIECWNENEKFYKIGKTFTSIERRYKNSFIPYNFKILKQIEGEAKFIHDLELKLKNKNKAYKYLPIISFGGKYECFSEIKYYQ